MDDDGAAMLGKLIIFIAIASIAITAAIFLGGPLLALYTLVKGWEQVSTRVKVGAILLPCVGAGIALWSIAQGQIYTWDWATIFLLGSPFFSMGMVGIAYWRYQRANALPNLTSIALPTTHIDRVCAHCGSINRAGYKYCSVCGKGALDAKHSQIQGP